MIVQSSTTARAPLPVAHLHNKQSFADDHCYQKFKRRNIAL
jgi:hypothetical protein